MTWFIRPNRMASWQVWGRLCAMVRWTRAIQWPTPNCLFCLVIALPLAQIIEGTGPCTPVMAYLWPNTRWEMLVLRCFRLSLHNFNFLSVRSGVGALKEESWSDSVPMTTPPLEWRACFFAFIDILGVPPPLKPWYRKVLVIIPLSSPFAKEGVSNTFQSKIPHYVGEQLRCLQLNGRL